VLILQQGPKLPRAVEPPGAGARHSSTREFDREAGPNTYVAPRTAAPRYDARFVSLSMMPRLLRASNRSKNTSRMAWRPSLIDLNLRMLVPPVG
jgi:hypothetical protein